MCLRARACVCIRVYYYSCKIRRMLRRQAPFCLRFPHPLPPPSPPPPPPPVGRKHHFIRLRWNSKFKPEENQGYGHPAPCIFINSLSHFFLLNSGVQCVYADPSAWPWGVWQVNSAPEPSVHWFCVYDILLPHVGPLGELHCRSRRGRISKGEKAVVGQLGEEKPELDTGPCLDWGDRNTQSEPSRL